jgi:hypothetical protein
MIGAIQPHDEPKLPNDGFDFRCRQMEQFADIAGRQPIAVQSQHFAGDSFRVSRGDRMNDDTPAPKPLHWADPDGLYIEASRLHRQGYSRKQISDAMEISIGAVDRILSCDRSTRWPR